MPFVDRLLDGGAVPGEVYGVQHVGASCGLAFAATLVLAAGTVEHERVRLPNRSGKSKLAYLVSCPPVDEHDVRCWLLSCIAQIKLSGLRQGWPSLSTTGRLKPYERQLFRLRRKTENVPGEQERAEARIPAINAGIVYRDLSRSDPLVLRTVEGAVGEIVRHIQETQSARNAGGVSTVVVVGARGLVQRYLHENDLEDDCYAQSLGKFLRQFNLTVAHRFDCDVWMQHEAMPDEIPPRANLFGVDPDLADWTLFDHRVHAWFSIDSPLENGLCVLSRDDRNGPFEPHPPEVIQLDREFCSLLSVKDKYLIDASSGRIYEAYDLRGSRAGNRRRG